MRNFRGFLYPVTRKTLQGPTKSQKRNYNQFSLFQLVNRSTDNGFSVVKHHESQLRLQGFTNGERYFLQTILFFSVVGVFAFYRLCCKKSVVYAKASDFIDFESKIGSGISKQKYKAKT